MVIGTIGVSIIYLLNPETIAIDLQEWNKETDTKFIYLLLPALFIYTGFVEELCVRGGLYRALRFSFRMLTAVIISAIIFTFFHFWSNPATIVIMTLQSMLFAWYVEYKNNLMTVSITHSLHDMLIVGLTSHMGLLLANMILNS